LGSGSDRDTGRRKKGAAATPPQTPRRRERLVGLVSPRKLAQIPKTPHRPSIDTFWSQEFINDWNDEHSPKKLILPPVEKSPSKASPKKATSQREAKKDFEGRRHGIAETFLRELDETITDGKLGELANSTGGIKINWTNKLNTTAGRANWKRETISSKQADGAQVSVRYRHHASIELAEKVIDDEHRLLNVIAHEFCHLANFMVSGITGNPHGKEFKAWAAKCSRKFGGRGIEVTTKHSYDIDFKYVWECTSCSSEYKRHSKSINPDRHRCGACKSVLKQTKPVPRGTGKPSEYQKFMKEHMKSIKEENPGSPQKDVMRMVAERWARQRPAEAVGRREDTLNASGLEDVVAQLEDLTIEVDASG
jgi:predicted SprT family Zn-dependent metalloprotease